MHGNEKKKLFGSSKMVFDICDFLDVFQMYPISTQCPVQLYE
jgi:hypothetical protein